MFTSSREKELLDENSELKLIISKLLFSARKTLGNHPYGVIEITQAPSATDNSTVIEELLLEHKQLLEKIAFEQKQRWSVAGLIPVSYSSSETHTTRFGNFLFKKISERILHHSDMTDISINNSLEKTVSEAEALNPAWVKKLAYLKTSETKNQELDNSIESSNAMQDIASSDLLNAKLDELSQKVDVSVDDILSAGVALVDLALKARENGKKFGVVEPDQPVITEVIGV